jgi:hypothetical protein
MFKVTERGMERLGEPRESLTEEDIGCILEHFTESSEIGNGAIKVGGCWRQRHNASDYNFDNGMHLAT